MPELYHDNNQDKYPGKIVTNLDSIFKSREITLPIKGRPVKAMVFPLVIYGCESWKAKCQRIDFLNCGVEKDS